MEKLKLEHIAPYLPYGLKCQIDLGQNEIIITDSWGLKTGSDYPASYYDEGKRYGLMLSQIKPLLHPMSDLYKEIDGEIPADILFPKEYYSLIDFYEEHNRENQIQSFIKDGLNWCETYSFWEYLLSKHFDVFSLIDNGLAIDIKSISYE